MMSKNILVFHVLEDSRAPEAHQRKRRLVGMAVTGLLEDCSESINWKLKPQMVACIHTFYRYHQNSHRPIKRELFNLITNIDQSDF